ncbi:MAG: hypothetical protein ABFD52_08895 [Acidobacteriota bacterium]
MTNGNSKFNVEALKTIGLIVALLTIIAQGLFSGGAGKSKLEEKINAQGEKIARLEECVLSLRPLPAQVAGIEATVKAIERTINARQGEK